MRSAGDVATFRAEADAKWDSDRAAYYTTCYAACIPRMFWDVRSGDVTHNIGVFRDVIQRYCARRQFAQRRGYSLLLMGDNGVGKTMFLSYILTQMIRRGASVHYTTLAGLDVDIKRGFKDGEAERRLDEALDVDFLAIDELGKEHYRGDSYLMSRLEQLLKRRYDDGDPVLLATNLDYEKLCSMYGSSVASMFDGKYHAVQLESGDFRKGVSSKMRADMGYK